MDPKQTLLTEEQVNKKDDSVKDLVDNLKKSLNNGDLESITLGETKLDEETLIALIALLG